MNKKAKYFQLKALNFDQQVIELTSMFNTFSFYRIVTFVVFFVGAILCIKYGLGLLLFVAVVLFVFIFGLLINHHNKIAKKKKISQLLSQINKEEVKRLNHDFEGIYDGNEFVDEHHPYAVDLDIFGRSSLFQLINRAGTVDGAQLLKSWLVKASSKEIIELRQKAISELSPMIEWRQKLQAFGSFSSSSKENKQAFYTWLKGEDMIRSKFFFRIIPYAIIVFFLSLLGGVVFGNLSQGFLLLPVIISGYLLYKIKDYSRATYDLTLTGVNMLESVENIVHLIENKKFEHDYLINFQNHLKPKDMVASRKIKDLRKIFELLSLRGNQIFMILNITFLFDFILLALAEKWRASYKHEIAGWFDSIAEFEALSSVAAFAFANEGYVFPEIKENDFFFQGTNIGHPLMPDDQRINNDFELHGRGKSCIITGSNMAGKSTFLRTVGINAVLALAGAPVCADSFQISYFQVFTSMRTKDNLEENISSFYAELLRLKMLLEQIKESNSVFFLLDEILKGTNSVDRHIGAESLIIQLNKLDAFGLVSTHDLELGKLCEKNNQIANFNFSSRINEEEIIFDYKLRPGICQSTNASQLMAKMGIQIKS